MSVISITFAQCDGIEQKLRDAGVIETVDLESRGRVETYECINRKACSEEKWNEYKKRWSENQELPKNIEYYPVQFRKDGNEMIALANYGSAQNVADFASAVLKGDIVHCFEETEGKSYGDWYLKDGDEVMPDGKPVGNVISNVSSKLIKPLKNNPNKSVFVIPLSDKGCRTVIVDNENIWDTYADTIGRKNDNKNISLPRDSSVRLYNPANKEVTKASSMEVVQMFNKSREDYLNLMEEQTRRKYSQQNTLLDDTDEKSESDMEF